MNLMDGVDEKVFQFGEFRLDLEEKVLRRNGAIIPLQARVFDVLCMLVERRGGVVSKEELMETIWADSFVEESNITQSIYSLRRALGNDASGNSMIETVPKRGYRLSVPVGTGVDRRTATNSTPPVEMRHSPQGTGYRMGLLAILALVAVGIGAFYTARYFTVRSIAPIENVKFQKLTFSGDIAFPMLSRDGQSLAYIKENAIYLQDVATGSSIKLDIPGHDHFGNIQFSNEGDSIFFRNEDSFDAAGDVFKVSRFGGAAKLVANQVWSTVGLSPDSSVLAFVRFYPKEGEWSLITKDVETGKEAKLLSRNLPFTIYRRGFPAWSPNGERIVIVEQTPNETNISRILIVNVATSATETLSTPRFIQIEQVGWKPNGSGLFITGRENNRFFQLWEMDLPTADVRPLTNDLNSYRNLSVSADGRTILASQNSLYSHIWTATADDPQNQTQITFGNLNRDGNAGLAWSLDSRIVYTTRITGNVDLWSIRPEDGVRNQLTDNAGTRNENPFVTADGRYVYFESGRSGRQHIWRSNIDGSNPTQITFADNETDFFPVVTPDGNTLFYIQRTPKSNVIWRHSLTDGTREMVTQPGKLSPGRFLSISPDGAYLLFDDVSDDKKNNGSIAVVFDVTTKEAKIVTLGSPNVRASFSPDGRFLDYFENRPESARFWRQPLDGKSERKLLFELPRSRIEDFDWSRDGKTLAIARGRQENDAMLLTGF